MPDNSSRNSPLEFADAKIAMAISRMIGPDLSEEAAMRLLYPNNAAEIYTPWHKSHMVTPEELSPKGTYPSGRRMRDERV